MDTSIINHLSLKDSFRGCSIIDNINKIDDYFKELVEHTNRTSVFIYDDLEKGFSTFIVDSNGLHDKVLVVSNRNHQDLFLLHIDGVMYKKNTKCDCALFTNKELLFVEFKTNAANKAVNARIDNYEKCYLQLEITIKDFIDRYSNIGIDFLDMFSSVCAYAVFNPTVPYDNTTEKNLSAKFLKNNGVKLRFLNEVNFL